MRKIQAMHKAYGENVEHKCKECCNLSSYRANKVWYKCEAYGNSCSEATDWAKSNVACGMFNVPFDSKKTEPLIEKLKHERKDKPPLSGQITIS